MTIILYHPTITVYINQAVNYKNKKNKPISRPLKSQKILMFALVQLFSWSFGMSTKPPAVFPSIVSIYDQSKNWPNAAVLCWEPRTSNCRIVCFLPMHIPFPRVISFSTRFDSPKVVKSGCVASLSSFISKITKWIDIETVAFLRHPAPFEFLVGPSWNAEIHWWSPWSFCNWLTFTCHY